MPIPPLPAGIPSIAGYERLLGTDEFAAVQRFSDRFLAAHRRALRPYSRQWVADPLRQWSRQWEYPFALSQIASALADRPGEVPVRILDAGSGVTFLPFLLAQTFPGAAVWCCDWDSSLEPIFGEINESGPPRVEFVAADLHELPFEPGWFDLVYSVSVLEHTDRRAAIVDEFHRVLTPGGRLVLTFDLPADAAAEDDGTRGMLSALARRFAVDGDPLRDWASVDKVTTSYAAALDRRLLPWRHPVLYRLSCLLSGHGWPPWPPALTVCCLSLTRRD